MSILPIRILARARIVPNLHGMTNAPSPPETAETTLGAAWRTDQAPPSERQGARLRMLAHEVIDREIPALSETIVKALAIVPVQPRPLLEILDVQGRTNGAVHDAIMTLIYLDAFEERELAAIVRDKLRGLAATARPGSAQWQSLARLTRLWQVRARPPQSRRWAISPPDEEDAPVELTWPLDMVVEDQDRAGDAVPVSPAQHVPLAPRERRIGVLDRIAPRNADRMSEVEAYQPLIDGIALRRFQLGIDEIVAALRTEFPWFGALIDDIEAEWRLSAGMGRDWIRIRPILIHGPPGIGKSRFVARLAGLAGTGHAFLSVSGSSDNRQLAGTAAGWSTATPCWPAQMMLKLDCANPILMIDEVDKTSEDRRNGRVIDTLLTMIEPETGRMWSDECLGGALDLSHASWLLCANDLSHIDPTLRSRVRCIAVEGPAASDFAALHRRMLADIAREFETDAALLPALADPVVAALAEGFAKTRSIRRLRRALEIALGQQIRSDRARPN